MALVDELARRIIRRSVALAKEPLSVTIEEYLLASRELEHRTGRLLLADAEFDGPNFLMCGVPVTPMAAGEAR